MSAVIRPIEILLVEDNAGDVELTQEAFADSKIFNSIHVVSDGVEAIDFLNRRSPYEKAVRPDVILLDLNMPRMDGKEVLEVIKADPELRKIPVVVLTCSEADKDIVRSYKLRANCYITKPVDLSRFLEIVKAIEDFWLTAVKLPGKGNQQVA